MDADVLGVVVGAFSGAVAAIGLTLRTWARARTKQREAEATVQRETIAALKELAGALSQHTSDDREDSRDHRQSIRELARAIEHHTAATTAAFERVDQRLDALERASQASRA